MDPITHGLLGGVTAASLRRRPLSPWIAAAGAVGGMLPDLDVLIRNRENPLLLIEYHRHFTHSLAFIPLGGLIAAFFVWLLTKRRHPFGGVYFAATAGYATHCLLDACTTYGTVLLWPFSERRISWDVISIIDPIMTLVLLLGFLLVLVRRRPLPARIALALALGYLGLGWFQHQRVLEDQARLAVGRGHQIVRGRANPSFGNMVVWRSFYESGGRIYIDALRRLPGGGEKTYPGGALPAFDPAQLKPPPPEGSKLARDLKTYLWFSEGWLGVISNQPWILGDVRFGGLPNDTRSFWNIALWPEAPDRGAERIRFSAVRWENLKILGAMIRGENIPVYGGQ